MKMILRLFLAVAAIAMAVGDTFAQGQGRGGRGFGTPSAYILVAMNKDLQEELKINEEQLLKVTDALKPIGEKQRELFGQGGGQNATDAERKERTEKMAKLAEETKAAIEKVLDAKQNKRLSEINHQVMGFAAFSDKSAQEKLKLTDEQKGKIKTMSEELATAQQDARKDMPRFQQGQQFSDEDRKKMTEIQTKTRELGEKSTKKAAELLTDDQKTTWKEMVGTTFDVAKLTTFRPRGN